MPLTIKGVFMNEALLCLAMVVFKESRGEPIKAQYAVLEVVHNRTKHPNHPKDYCSVIKQPRQFSWYKGGKIKPPTYELEAWKQSVEVAKSFTNKKTNYTNGAIFFNHKSLGIRYAITTDHGRAVRLGNHVFF